MKKIILLFILISSLSLAEAQQLLQERRYQVNGLHKYIVSSVPDGQGNILFSGAALAAIGKFNTSFLLVKPNADTLWTRKGPENSPSELQGIINTPGGFLYFGGKRHPTINSMGGPLLQKLNGNGMPVWTQHYYDIMNNGGIPLSALNMADKGFMLGGGFKVNGQNRGFALARTDSVGNILWKKHYTSGSFDGLLDIRHTTNGNIIAAGIVDSPVPPRHLKLVLLNQNGDSLLGRQLIVSCFNCYEDMYGNWGKVLALSDGGFLINAVADTTINGNEMPYRGMLVKVDASLNLVWKYILRSPVTTEGYILNSPKELADGSILALGFKLRPTVTSSFQLYRFSPFGKLLNTYPIQSNICNEVWGVTLDALTDSTFMIGGRCNNFGNIGFYVATVKLNGLPAVLPPVTGTKPEVPLQAALGQSYPNPAQDQAVIPYNLPDSIRSAIILLTDITGREVGSYNLKLKQKQGLLPVNLSTLSGGLYLYTLLIDGRVVATKKLAVAR